MRTRAWRACPLSARIFFSAALAGKPLRRQGFFYLGGITATVCGAYGFRRSYLKLTGQRANESECARYGVEYVEPKLWQ